MNKTLDEYLKSEFENFCESVIMEDFAAGKFIRRSELAEFIPVCDITDLMIDYKNKMVNYLQQECIESYVVTLRWHNWIAVVRSDLAEKLN